MEETYIYYSKKNAFILLLISTGIISLLLFVFYALRPLPAFEIWNDAIFFWALCFFLLFGAVMFFFGFSRLVSSKPALIFNEQGIIDKTTPFSLDELILWEDFLGFYPYTQSKVLQWGYVLKDEEKYLKRKSLFMRMLIKPNSKMGIPYFSLPLAPLAVSPENLTNIIKEYKEFYFYYPAD
ncbi:STM3941 family protein [Bacillus sp. SCS-153A]|uniref:STM3941 family protein n=1 Tax=Rossellomorea sedimentorum TaxID=3115294 RepID=UPI0039063DDE